MVDPVVDPVPDFRVHPVAPAFLQLLLRTQTGPRRLPPSLRHLSDVAMLRAGG